MHLSTSAFANLGDRFQMRWIGPIFMVLSLVGFGIGAFGLHENNRFDGAVQTTGVSIDKILTTTRSGPTEDRYVNKCWKPVIKFQDQETMREHTFTSNICDLHLSANPVGTIYDVEYVPGSQPMLAREAGAVNTWMMPMIGFTIGAGFLLMGGLFTVVFFGLDKARRRSAGGDGVGDYDAAESAAEQEAWESFVTESRARFEQAKRDERLRNDDGHGPGHAGSDGPITRY